jgi:NAD dependent epimerase/dehydratase family enzyme
MKQSEMWENAWEEMFGNLPQVEEEKVQRLIEASMTGMYHNSKYITLPDVMRKASEHISVLAGGWEMAKCLWEKAGAIEKAVGEFNEMSN